MITVEVNGAPLMTVGDEMRTMGDLVELVKANIDPDVMITLLTIDGQQLSENDWRAPLSNYRNEKLEVRTGSKREYLTQRLQSAEQLIGEITRNFEGAGALYNRGDSEQGNAKFGEAVKDFLAFVNWYNTLLQIEPQVLSAASQAFTSHVGALHSTCEQLLQQQLYHSWWALSQTITAKLLPQLNQVQSFCGSIAQDYARA